MANLPVPLNPLLGRSRELDGVGETLRRARLVTLIGPGGVGKTRLALELARRQSTRRPDAVWLVDLTAGPDPAAEVARALDVGGRSTATPTESLRRYLEDRPALLVLDNCEHVIDDCARLTTTLLTSCEDVRILATSRESLGVSGETVWRVEPLGAQDAQRLFVERARQRQADFIPTPEVDAVIATLCERVDHLPLAIELAAARIGALAPAEILAGLEARLELLGGGSRSGPARHRTVRAAIEWSYDLLDPAEQTALRSLAVFVGGFDATAAVAVAPDLTLDVFTRLVDKSVIAAGRTPRGRTRYRLLDTVREYAGELLVAAGELDAARERHLRHFAAVGGTTQLGWPSWEARELLEAREDDYENIRAALDRAVATDPCAGMHLFSATRDLFTMLGQADGRRLAQELLAGCTARDRCRVVVLITHGLLAMLMANVDAARAALRDARALAAELDHDDLEGYAAFFQGLTDTLDVELEAARPSLEAARSLHGAAGNARGRAGATAALGLTYGLAGDPGTARELLNEALAVQTTTGYGWGEGQAHLYLGITLGAADHYRRAVAALHPYRDSTLLPFALIGQAGLIGSRDPARALTVVAAAHAIRTRVGGDFPRLYREQALRVRAECEAKLGTDAERIWAEGSRLGVDDAVAQAFGEARRAATAAPAGLSERELDVVRLVAQGRSNKAIAAELQLSVRTVESHVRHVLAKAGLENRTQLATWAHAHVP